MRIKVEDTGWYHNYIQITITDNNTTIVNVLDVEEAERIQETRKIRKCEGCIYDSISGILKKHKGCDYYTVIKVDIDGVCLTRRER